MYLSYYKLNKKPFEINTDPSFLWLGERYKEALSIFKYGVTNDKGFLLLTGDVGTGKTTLINAFINILGDDVLAARVSDPGLTKLDFMKYVARMFKIETAFERKSEFLILFTQFLTQADHDNKKVILIIDEVQQLSDETLEEIRLLSNIEKQDKKLFTILLVGQNEFNDTLGKYKNRALRQRLSISYTLYPFKADETRACVEYRLTVAGAKKEIFTPKAIEAIHSISKGFPRVVNIICDHALLLGYVEEQETISDDIIWRCSKELHPAHFPPSHEQDKFFNSTSEWLEESEIPPLTIEAIERASKPLPDPEMFPNQEPQRKSLISRAMVPILAASLLLGGIFAVKEGKIESISQIFTKKSSETVALTLAKDQPVAVTSPDTTKMEGQKTVKTSEIDKTTNPSSAVQAVVPPEPAEQQTLQVETRDEKATETEPATAVQQPLEIKTPEVAQVADLPLTTETVSEIKVVSLEAQNETKARPREQAITSDTPDTPESKQPEIAKEEITDVKEETPIELEAIKAPPQLVTEQPPAATSQAADLLSETDIQNDQEVLPSPTAVTLQKIEPPSPKSELTIKPRKTTASPVKAQPAENDDPGAIIDWLLKAKQNQ